MDEEEWGRKGEDYETCEARENEKKIWKMQVKVWAQTDPILFLLYVACV